MNFKKLLIFFAIGFGFTVLISSYKVIQLELFPWLNVLISSFLSFSALISIFLVRGKNKIIQVSTFLFFIVQFLLNYIILQDAEILKVNWRWLFYPVSILIFILCFAPIGRKQEKFRLLLFILLSLSFFSFIVSLFQGTSFWFSSQISWFFLFSIGIVFIKNKEKIER